MQNEKPLRQRLHHELLESRRVCASLSGAIWIDNNGDSVINDGDEPVAAAIVWLDNNRNGLREVDEPATRSSGSGSYAFEGLSAGNYEVRMQPPPGLFQTNPSEYFAFYGNGQPDQFGLAEIDIASGAVTERTPTEFLGLRHGLIKTIQGDYFGAGHSTDSLFRIDPITGVQKKIGHTGKELVAGLAYDPIMDKIYTLGRVTDIDFPELNLYEVDRTTAQLTRVGTGDGIAGIRGTSGVTFDMVHREVVLFDNNLNEIIAYDLNGQGRKIFQFPGHTAFYNLAFDGHRLLTFHTDEQNVTRLYEVDRESRALKQIQTLESSLNVNAADILGVNQAIAIDIDSDSAQLSGANFLTNQMDLRTATLQISDNSLKLTSPDGLDVDFSLESPNVPIRFCVAAQPSQLTIQQHTDAPSLVTVATSDFDDVASLDKLPNFGLHMGAGYDTLAFTGPLQFDLATLTGLVTDVEEIDLTQADGARLLVHSAALRSFNQAHSLTVFIASHDQLELNDRPWRLAAPKYTTGDTSSSRRHQLMVDDVLLELIDGHSWRNPLLVEDVNRDGVVSSIDALKIINELNIGRSRSLSNSNNVDAMLDYVDPNGDNFLSPLDALLIITRLNG